MTQPVTNHPLPQWATAFVGREQELRHLVNVLASDQVRLVTILGMGGMGKTRLAVAVAEHVSERFEEVQFLDLTAAHPPTVLGLIAGRLGAKGTVKSIAETLGDKRTLVLLDCFEGVVTAAKDLEQLVQHCPTLSLLVTSREPLRNLSWECRLTLSPLAVPEDDTPLEVLTQNPAVALFSNYAKRTAPTFTLSEETIKPVTAICQRLEGVPLALELAAPRLKLLSPAMLLKKLEDRFKVLTSSGTTQLSRHYAVQSVLENSYQTLSPEAQYTLCCASTFVQGWTMEALEAVIADEAVDIWKVLNELVDTCFISTDMASHEARFTMLDTVREFGFNKLLEREDANAVQRRHALYFACLIYPARRTLVGPEQKRWMGRLERDYTNFMTARTWSITQRNVELELKLVSTLGYYWWLSGMITEGCNYVADTLSRSRGLTTPDNAQAFVIGGILHTDAGDLHQAEACLNAAKMLAESLNHTPTLGDAHNNLGYLAMLQDDFARAEDSVQKAVDCFTQAGEHAKLPAMLCNLGELYQKRGDETGAKQLYERALFGAKSQGNTQNVINILINLASVEYSVKPETSLKHYLEALRLAREVNHRIRMAMVVEYIAALLIRHGDVVRGTEFLATSFTTLKATGYVRAPDQAEHLEQTLQLARKRLPSHAFDAAWQHGSDQDFDVSVHHLLSSKETVTLRVSVKRSAPEAEVLSVLSKREAQVLELLAEGQADKAIAKALEIAPRTVEYHVTSIMNKLGAKNRTHAVVLASQQGLLATMQNPQARGARAT